MILEINFPSTSNGIINFFLLFVSFNSSLLDEIGKLANVYPGPGRNNVYRCGRTVQKHEEAMSVRCQVLPESASGFALKHSHNLRVDVCEICVYVKVTMQTNIIHSLSISMSVG